MMRSIAATHEMAARVCGAQGAYAEGYSAGFLDGLRAIAEALGIPFQPGAGNISIGQMWEG